MGEINMIGINVEKCGRFFAECERKFPCFLCIISYPALSLTEQVPGLETIMRNKTSVGGDGLDFPCLNNTEIS